MSDNENTTADEQAGTEPAEVTGQPAASADNEPQGDAADDDDFDAIITKLEAERDDWKKRAEDAEAALAAAQSVQDAPEPDPAAADKADGDSDAQDGSEGSEAAKWRRRLRDTERERDDIRDTLEAERRAIVAKALAEHRLPPRVLELAEVTTADLLDDETGLLSADKITATLARVAQEFVSVGPRRPIPNPLVGRDYVHPRESGEGTLRKAFGLGQ